MGHVRDRDPSDAAGLLRSACERGGDRACHRLLAALAAWRGVLGYVDPGDHVVEIHRAEFCSLTFSFFLRWWLGSRASAYDIRG